MRQDEWIKIAVVRPDNFLHIMNFITRVTAPNGDGIDIITEIEPTPENIENEIRRSGGDFIEWKIIQQEDLPTDRTYRNAWVLRNGIIEVDDTKALPIAMENIRLRRAALLNESDIYVMPDRWYSYTPEQQAAWSVYRQELRDFPATLENPFGDVIWPTKPI